MIIVEGNNELNAEMVLVPGIELISLTWDATPPFDTGSRHNWTLRMQNLAVGRLTYQLEMYMNDKRFMGYTANLYAGEVREISYPYTFGAEGSYTLTIKAYYESALLDEISKTVPVRAPVAPPFIDGEIIVASAWWEGGVWETFEASWVPAPIPQTWPASTDILTAWKVRNTGNVTTTFRVTFMGKQGSITLVPGEEWGPQFTVHTSSPGSYNYTRKLYGDGKLISSRSIGVTTF